MVQKIKHNGFEPGYTHAGITSADDFTEYEEEIVSREDYVMLTDENRSKYPNRADLRTAAGPKSFWPEARSGGRTPTVGTIH
ncbi:MAG: hypothetical protein VZQ84_00200 [Anaerovoracaceae bacterium]|nr:hypothetical protein [Anaerovoracaceae bacterium]